MSLGISPSPSPVPSPCLMDFLLDGSSSYGGIDHAAANHQNWSKPSNESGRAWLDQTLGKDTRTPVVGPYIPQVLQASHSEATWQSLQVDGITPTYGGSYSLERDFIHPFPRRQPEGQLTSIHGLLTPMIHPNRLTAVSAIHSDPTNMNPLARIADAEQLPSGWLICTGTEEIGDVHRDQTGSGETVGPSSLTIGSSLNAMTSFNQIQRIHEDSVRREIEHSLSTLFDLSPILTPAEALSPTFIVKNGSRYICGICSKSHARPSRAIACENDHLGYQPFVCDGTCGHPACRATFANRERLQNHKLPHSKTHMTCQNCGKHGWRRNAERHLRSCLSRRKPETSDED